MSMNVRPVRLTSQLVLVLTVGFLLAGCSPRRTELVVHNRTTVAIVFTEMTTTNVVPACSTMRYDWTGAGWKSVDPVEVESPLPGEAMTVSISFAPPADAARQTVVIVTADNVYGYPPAEAPSPPPCAGVPPTPPSPNPSVSKPVRTV